LPKNLQQIVAIFGETVETTVETKQQTSLNR
jgi:hypothetical protein